MIFQDNNDITSGIDHSIWTSIIAAIDNADTQTFHVLKRFARNVLQHSVRHNSKKHFVQYIRMYPNMYLYSYRKFNGQKNFEEFHVMCVDEVTRHLKEIIWFDIGVYEKENPVRDLQTVNEFYQITFGAINTLIHYLIRNQDVRSFERLMEQYDQLPDRNSSDSYQQKWRIRDLVQNNENGSNDVEIAKLRNDFDLKFNLNTLKRRTLLATKYWLIYLYSKNKIERELLNQFLEKIRIPHMDSHELLKDILFFRSSVVDAYVGWSEWDYEKRPEGKVYSPPSPYDWLTFGFIADQLKENKLFIQVGELDEKELSGAQFLYDEIKNLIGYFEQHFSKWKPFFNVSNQDELKSKSNEILKLFAVVKRKQIGALEKSIAGAKLSEPKVEQFKKMIGDAWSSQAKIRNLFKDKGVVNDVTGTSEKLTFVGYNTFFAKAKMMFIEENYQNIYGVDRMGSDIGRWDDELFFRTIAKSKKSNIKGESTVELIELAIRNLSEALLKPDLILAQPEIGYKDKKLLEHPKYQDRKWAPNNNEPDSNLLGLFDGIPIYYSYSNYLSNKIVVCNFNSAFSMSMKTDDTWFSRELKVDVKEITDSDAENILKSEPDKWKNTEDDLILSDEDALMLIKTSISLEIGSLVDYKISNEAAFVVGYFVTDSE